MIDDAVLALLNHLLNQASWARQRLAPFAGKQARLSMPPWQVCIRVTEDGWFGPAGDEATADVDISLPAEAPFLALRGVDKLIAGARIEGTAQFARELTYVLQHLRWDYEEDLARLLGDITAHRIAAGLAALGQLRKQGAERLLRGVVSRAVEAKLLASRSDQQTFADGIAELRSMLERSERRGQALSANATVRR